MASETGSRENRDFSIGSSLSELGGLSEAVREFLAQRGVSRTTLFTVELALEEVITNILKYADLAPGTGKIAVHLELASDRVTLVIEDDGRQFDPVQALEPDLGQRIEDRPIGGVGLCLVRRMVQLFRYERRGAINHLEIGIDRLSE
jgi:anti-sigma regulatory factor (Ser/Thr protein kinase)